MIKRLLPFLFFFRALSLSYGQDAVNPMVQLDNTVKSLAAEISKTLPAGENPKVSVSSWNYRDSAPDFSSYWAAQLVEELTNISGRSFVLVSMGASDWTLAGEIVESANVIRVYTRLIRSRDHSIVASFHSDFEPSEYLVEMLAGSGSSFRRSSVSRDAYEVDSLENPLAVEIAADSGGPVINRTIHTENDTDYFLLVPDRDGRLVMETSGDTVDTIMALYDAATQRQLTSNDDGGSNENARIQYQVRSGERYIASVRSYGSDVGRYGFHAWIVEAISADEYEDDNDRDSAKEIHLGTPQQHTFTTGNDVDWVTFRIDRAGRYEIRVRGVNSTRLDTYIELYDRDLNFINENDDGGEYYDSRLSVNLQPGTYYLKVECFDNYPEEPYTIRIDERSPGPLSRSREAMLLPGGLT
ncbi:MAG: PPC domain-containing protein [Treponema sp.]|nr:PPC domain-containing protein [Treponema sp.]